MGTPTTLDGTVYTLPAHRETGWHTQVDPFFQKLVSLLETSIKRLRSIFQLVTATTGATTIDFSLGHNVRLTLQASTTLTFTNTREGERYVLHLKQDATGGRTITWPVAVKWVGGAPTLSTAANARDLVALMFDDAVYLGDHKEGFA